MTSRDPHDRLPCQKTPTHQEHLVQERGIVDAETA
jgi:hypothetical protein